MRPAVVASGVAPAHPLSRRVQCRLPTPCNRLCDTDERYRPKRTPTHTKICGRRPARRWYRPGPQVYGGLAGMLWIDDADDARLGLPDSYGVNDLPIAIQDRRLDARGHLRYMNAPGDIMGMKARCRAPRFRVQWHGRHRFVEDAAPRPRLWAARRRRSRRHAHGRAAAVRYQRSLHEHGCDLRPGRARQPPVLAGNQCQRMAHPFHMHGTSFVIHRRNGQPPHERGWKDVVLGRAGETVTLYVPFRHPVHRGHPYIGTTVIFSNTRTTA